MNGPGVYDAMCTVVREELEAKAAVLIVLGGNMGNGFSVQVEGALVLELPELLRYVANEIEQSGARA